MAEARQSQTVSPMLIIVILVAILALVVVGVLLYTITDEDEEADTPEAEVNAIVDDAVGEDAETEFTGNLINVTFPLNQVRTDVARENGKRDMLKAICALREAGYTETRRVTLIGTLTRENNQGVTETVRGITAEFEPTTIGALPCDDLESIDLEAVANVFMMHPDLQEE